MGGIIRPKGKSMYFEYYEKYLHSWQLTKVKFWQGVVILFMKAIKPQEYEWVQLATPNKN